MFVIGFDDNLEKGLKSSKTSFLKKMTSEKAIEMGE